MARRIPNRRKAKKGSKLSKKDNGDWMKHLKELDYVKLLEYAAMFHPYVSALLGHSEAEVLVKILDAVTEIAPELRNQQETLKNVIGLCMEQTFQLQSEQFQNLSERLESLEGLLSNFNRAGIAGQLTGFFAGAEAIAQIRRLADSVEKIEGSLKGIEQNLDAISEQGDKFPQHIHEWLRMMLHEHSTDDKAAHYFVVFNRGTRWHSKFFAINQENPLSCHYLGHKTDLDELCAFLVDEVRPKVGPDAVLHILMPSGKPIVFADSIMFPERLRPFYIHGELGSEGSPFVWLCTPDDYDKAHTKYIGLLKPRGIWTRVHTIQVPGPFSEFLKWRSEPTWYIDPSWLNKMGGANILDFYDTGLYYQGPEPPRTLGQPCTRPWYTREHS